MRIYVDTSFLISLYSLDANSAAAAQTMRNSKGNHLVTMLGELEFTNALQLRVFRKEASTDQARASLKDFESDLRDRVFQLQALTDRAFEEARKLSQTTTARYTFDQHQRKLAQSVRLKLN